jgi:hypothetical protein
MAAGLSLTACQKPIHGDTSFEQQNKGFEGEMTPAQREQAIKEMQTKTGHDSD